MTPVGVRQEVAFECHRRRCSAVEVHQRDDLKQNVIKLGQYLDLERQSKVGRTYVLVHLDIFRHSSLVTFYNELPAQTNVHVRKRTHNRLNETRYSRAEHWKRRNRRWKLNARAARHVWHFGKYTSPMWGCVPPLPRAHLERPPVSLGRLRRQRMRCRPLCRRRRRRSYRVYTGEKELSVGTRTTASRSLPATN